MYSMYAEKRRWKLEVLNENETGLGGYKEISFMITGKGVYSRLKFESGVHRVQRVPDTESSGRIHTSTATVAVLPVVEDVEIEINPADIKMEVFRASGAGGQHINKTSSAVRLIHEPTGIVVECQTERSQFQNKDNAMKMLRTKLYEIEKEKQEELLQVAYEYIKQGKVESIRVSTRPDCIDKETLKRLKKYKVKTIELGVQSANDYILKRANRGHTFEDVKKASKND